MRRLLWTWIVGLFSIPLWAAEAQPDIEAARQFFAKLQIVRLDFQIGSQEMDSLRREPRVYVKAQLAENGAMTYKDVGVHLRGAAGSSRSIDDKAGLTINMDKFQKGQRFHGLDKWHLCNSVQDPSYVSEFICGEIMRDARVPAARISFAWVTINGRPRGLYYLKEAYDAQFLRTHIGHDEGNLYDGGFLQDLDANPKLIYSKNGLPDRKDLKVLVEAAREPDLNKRLARLHELLDMDRFLSYLCLEVIMHDWDGYPLNRNNFRIYHDIKRNKILFIPSGMDQMFSDVNLAVRPPFNGMIARALVEVPEGKELYYKRMKEIITQEYKPLERVRRLEELAKFLQDGVRPFDGRLAQEIPHQINRLKQAIPERGKVIERQLKEREARQKK